MKSGSKQSILTSGESADGHVDRLSYLADMIAEMEQLAAREGCKTVAGLLTIAAHEAQRLLKKARSVA